MKIVINYQEYADVEIEKAVLRELPDVEIKESRTREPAEFKGNLQGLFLSNTLLTNLLHLVSGNTTALVLRNYLPSVPAIAVGLVAGLKLYGHVNPALFRKLALGLLMVLGLQMVTYTARVAP